MKFLAFLTQTRLSRVSVADNQTFICTSHSVKYTYIHNKVLWMLITKNFLVDVYIISFNTDFHIYIYRWNTKNYTLTPYESIAFTTTLILNEIRKNLSTRSKLCIAHFYPKFLLWINFHHQMLKFRAACRGLKN